MPSFSELILSFGQPQSEIARPKTSRSASSSSLIPPTISQPEVYGDFSNFRYPSKDTSGVERSQSYSYGYPLVHSRFSQPHPQLETGTPTETHPNMHVKSSSLPNIKQTGVLDVSTRRSKEEILLSSLSHTLESSMHNKDVQIIKDNYMGLVEQAPESISKESNILHGYVSSSNSKIKFITHESFKRFILATSPQTVDNLILEYNNNISTLKKFKTMIIQYNQEEEKANASVPPIKITFPKLQLSRLEQVSPTRKSVGSTKSPRKRKSSISSSKTIAAKSDPTSHNVGGNIVPLEIKKPTLFSGSPTSPVEIGALNPDLSIRQETHCSHCGSKSTPEWRKGLDGNRTLCNACGLFYSKLTKKYNAGEAAKIMKERKDMGTVNNRRIK